MFEINPHAVHERKEIGKNGVEKLFVAAVRKAGGRAYKFTSPGNRGVSDRLVLFPSQVWFVEIKKGTGKLTPLQVVFQEFITGLGLNHFVVYGEAGIDEFMEIANAKSREIERLRSKEV